MEKRVIPEEEKEIRNFQFKFTFASKYSQTEFWDTLFTDEFEEYFSDKANIINIELIRIMFREDVPSCEDPEQSNPVNLRSIYNRSEELLKETRDHNGNLVKYVTYEPEYDGERSENHGNYANCDCDYRVAKVTPHVPYALKKLLGLMTNVSYIGYQWKFRSADSQSVPPVELLYFVNTSDMFYIVGFFQMKAVLNAKNSNFKQDGIKKARKNSLVGKSQFLFHSSFQAEFSNQVINGIIGKLSIVEKVVQSGVKDMCVYAEKYLDIKHQTKSAPCLS